MKFLSLSLLLTIFTVNSFACDPYDPLCGLDGQPLPFPSTVTCQGDNFDDPLCELSTEDLIRIIADEVTQDSAPTETTEEQNEEEETIQSEQSFTAANAAPVKCRDAVVAAKKALGETIDPQSFSVADFSALNLSSDEINALSVAQQASLYMKVMPMEIMVMRTLHELNEEIDGHANSYLAIFATDKIQSLRAIKDKLQSCVQ